MKAVNRICQILAILFGAASVVLFFMPLVNFVTGNVTEAASGTQLAFGGEFELGGVAYDMARSSKILFCLIITAVAFLMSCLSFKKKGLRYTVPVLSLVSGIFMLVVALGDEVSFVDTRPIEETVKNLRLEYTSLMIFVPIAILLFAVISAAYLLIDDYVEVTQSKGAKKTIMQRLVNALRDYKSEVTKIVWPKFRDVIKNTVIVLIMCLLVGVVIWAIDYGLGELLKWLYS